MLMWNRRAVHIDTIINNLTIIVDYNFKFVNMLNSFHWRLSMINQAQALLVEKRGISSIFWYFFTIYYVGNQWIGEYGLGIKNK